jgi:probable rRNA maturation factor
MAKKGKSSPERASERRLPGVQCGPVLHPGFPLSPRELSHFTRRLLDLLGLDRLDPEIRLVEDREISRLNREHLGIPGPTNVLSFPLGGHVSGIVVLSMDAVIRESFLYGQAPLEQLTRLLTHGLLHLSGLDHGPEMDRLTDRALTHLRELRTAV